MGKREVGIDQDPELPADSLGENPGREVPGHRKFYPEEVNPFLDPKIYPKPEGPLRRLLEWAQENKKRVVVVSAISAIGTIIGVGGLALIMVGRRRMLKHIINHNPQADITDSLKEQNQP